MLFSNKAKSRFFGIRNSDALYERCHREASARIETFKNSGSGFDLGAVSKLHFRHKNSGTEIAFVDIVLEGGGAKGIALVGAIFAMEQLGLRWRKMAGTSSGAIVAAALALSDRSFDQPKADQLLKLLAEFDMTKLFDGGKQAHYLMGKLKNAKQSPTGKSVILNLLRSLRGITKLRDIQRHLAINPGNSFVVYFENLCRKHCKSQSFSVDDIKQRWRSDAGLIQEAYVPIAAGLLDEQALSREMMAELQVITLDILNSRKAALPKDATWYGIEEASMSVPYMVRASIAIPLVFSPVSLHKLSTQTSFNGKEGMFVDGFLVENLALDIFDEEDVEEQICPTFGLLIDESMNQQKIDEPKTIDSIGRYIKALVISLVDQQWAELDNRVDDDRIIRISNAVTDEQQGEKRIEVLDFDMTDEEVEALFLNGVDAVINKFKGGWTHDKHLDLQVKIADE